MEKILHTPKSLLSHGHGRFSLRPCYKGISGFVHRNVTCRCYTHVLNRGGHGVLSPLDRS